MAGPDWNDYSVEQRLSAARSALPPGYVIIQKNGLEAKEGPFDPKLAADKIERTARIIRIPNTRQGIYDCLPAQEAVRIECFHRFEVEGLLAFLRADR